MQDLLLLADRNGLYGGGCFGIIVLALDLIALFGLLTGRSSFQHKLLWTLLILLMPCLGVGLYFLIGRRTSDNV